MIFSLNWLKEYVDIPCSGKELADKLSLCGHEVEAVIEKGAGFCNVITGKIEKIEPHPNADKLVICQVSDGQTLHQIVTGAKNVFEGAIVPASLPGAVLANGLKIKHGELRGVPSNGMLCSEAELGVLEEAQGIWILPEDTPVGVDFIEYAQLQDTLLDISILPNRGDCQSVVGMARDISALLRTPLRLPNTAFTTQAWDSDLSVTIQEKSGCDVYMGRQLQSFSTTLSPLWMQRRLQVSGIRPINLMVDVTNYVLLEFGQPLHAFDESLLKTKHIQVRCATDKEAFVTLDGKKHALPSDATVVCDQDTPIALGGVMGGQNTEISEQSQSVFLEGAYFSPVSVRRTAKMLDLRTESAVRFEKGVDPEAIATALDRACHLYQSLGGASVREQQVAFKKEESLFTPITIHFDVTKINALLGSDFSESLVKDVLSLLGFAFNGASVTVPSWRRRDIESLPCLAEEAARIIGFDHIPSTLPDKAVLVEPASPLTVLRQSLSNSALSLGFSEQCSFSMVSPQDIEKLGQSLENAFVITNPISVEQSVMRPSLLPSLLHAVSFNLNRQIDSVKLFEMGQVYTKEPLSDNAVTTSTQFLGVIAGNKWDTAYTALDKSYASLSFAELKHMVLNLLSSSRLVDITFKRGSHDAFHPKQQLEIYCLKQKIGVFGALHPSVLKAFDIESSVWCVDLDLGALLSCHSKTPKYSAYSKFPTTRRDIAFVAPKSFQFGDILAVYSKHRPKGAKSCFLFDVFESEKIGVDNKSMAIGLIYQGVDRTLSDDEVNEAHTQFMAMLTQTLPITIR